MAHTNSKITAPIDVYGDLATFFGFSSGDLVYIMQRAVDNNIINKWAKWKPLKSNLLDLPTEELRRVAGRINPQDEELVYGVRASGLGSVNTPSDIHNCSFAYEKPTFAANSQWARVLDFVHPTEGNTYGYRSDAYLDFSSVVTWSHSTIVRNSENEMEVAITYSPHSATLRKEMMSIEDFLPDGLISYNILNFYPCVIITQGGYNYIHCLYKGTGTTPDTIGSTGTSYWRFDTRNLPSGLLDGSVLISVFLASSQRLISGDSSTDIANWVVYQDSGPQAWTAWFLPSVDATGFTKTISTVPVAPTKAVPISATGSANIVIVEYEWSDNYTGDINLTIQVGLSETPNPTIYHAQAFHQITASSATIGRIFRELFDYSEFGMIPIAGQTLYYKVNITTTIGSSQSTESITGSFVVPN